jgi:hypothetical protein
MMPWMSRVCAALVSVALLSPLCKTALALDDDTIACDRAARDAESDYGLPPGVLLAIGSVESGRWPWTANVDGAAEHYQSKTEALIGLTRVRTPKPGDVDVGCFQVSLKYHPSAFASMADALDPVANAHYAARFLHELHDKFGDWDRAIGAYHSATGPLEADYRDRVMASWKGATGAEQPRDPPVAEPPRWRVISIAAAVPFVRGAGALPRIITLGD